MPRRRLKEETKFKWREEWRPEEMEWLSSKDKDWMTQTYSEESYEDEEEEYEDEEWDWEEDEDEDDEYSDS